MESKQKIKAILIDLSGTIHVDDEPTPNAIQALQKLNAIENVKIRFVTNTTKESKDTLLKRLHRIGFNSINKTDMFTSLSAAVHYVETNHLKPLYLLTDDAKSEFPLIDAVNYDSVVVGLAPDQFNYDKMNEAFRILMKDESRLVAVHEGKYFKRSDGLAIGPGCFTRGLEYATGKKSIVIGKPNPYFFNCAIPNGLSPFECCMIGDDINDDIFGAMNIGMKGILVKTGKYIENIETKYSNKPTNICDTFANAIEWLISTDFEIE